MRVDKVVIVGGGASGWMTASSLIKTFPDLKVTLIEDPNTPSLGVGESTLSHFNEFLQSIGLTNDKDWMSYCNATYKNGALLKGFSEHSSELFFPLGAFNLQQSPNFHIWCELNKMYPDEVPCSRAAHFFLPNAFLVDNNKQTDNSDGTFPNFNFFYDVAYHIDSNKFGEYLKNNVCQDVEKIYAKVLRVYDKELFLSNGQVIDADLFVDCSGFKAVLSRSPWTSFGHILMNDSAVVGTIPYTDKKNQLTNKTTATAIDNGWVWEIPLWDRLSVGYCYSKKFRFASDAVEEFNIFCEEKYNCKPSTAHYIPFESGKRQEAWIGNVVSIGLSYSFIEPLESTGLLTTHESITALVDVLSFRNREINKMDIDGFNYVLDKKVDYFADFIGFHYGFSTRCDSPYWDHVTNCVKYNGIADDFWDSLIRDHEYHTNGSTFLLAVQNGYNPITEHNYFRIHKRGCLNDELPRIENNAKEWYNVYNATLERVNKLPSSYEFLRGTIYNDQTS